MKHLKPIFKATLLLMSAMIATNAAAYDFYEGGIYYSIIDWGIVEVVPPPSGNYSGDIVIPSTVTAEVSQYYETYQETFTVTGIDDFAFNGAYLSSITLPNTIDYIGDYAFYNCCDLQEFIFPNSVYRIGEYAFGYCTGLTSIVIPNSVYDIGWNAFYCCTGLTNVQISSSVNALGGTFFGCTSLTSVEIPASVELLEATFKNCSNLTSVLIPSSLQELSDNTFYGCDKLTTITCEAVNPPYTNDLQSFPESVYNLAKLFVPESSKTSYANAYMWKQFVNIFGIGEEVIHGDIDGDGRVSIADLANLIDLLLAGDSSNPDADVDGDGSMTIADVAALIDILLS